jgi:hypothetical protein
MCREGQRAVRHSRSGEGARGSGSKVGQLPRGLKRDSRRAESGAPVAGEESSRLGELDVDHAVAGLRQLAGPPRRRELHVAPFSGATELALVGPFLRQRPLNRLTSRSDCELVSVEEGAGVPRSVRAQGRVWRLRWVWAFSHYGVDPVSAMACGHARSAAGNSAGRRSTSPERGTGLDRQMPRAARRDDRLEIVGRPKDMTGRFGPGRCGSSRGRFRHSDVGAPRLERG